MQKSNIFIVNKNQAPLRILNWKKIFKFQGFIKGVIGSYREDLAHIPCPSNSRNDSSGEMV